MSRWAKDLKIDISSYSKTLRLRGLLLISQLGVLCSAWFFTAPLAAAPVAADERIPIDLRRTTLVVRDLERSLHLYRDVLGLQPIYDHVIRTPREAPTDQEADRSLRLVFLRANDDFVGVLGLMEYRKPRKSQPVSEMSFEPGTSVMVFNVADLEQRWAALSEVPGVEVLSPPSEISYPSYHGSGTLSVMVSVIRDPDGFVLELNQLLEVIR